MFKSSLVIGLEYVDRQHMQPLVRLNVMKHAETIHKQCCQDSRQHDAF